MFTNRVLVSVQTRSPNGLGDENYRYAMVMVSNVHSFLSEGE